MRTKQSEAANSRVESSSIARRDLLLGGGLALVAGSRPAAAKENGPASSEESFRYCLNTSTINGWKLSVPEQIEIAAKAGYSGVELWLPHLHDFVKGGGKPRDLRQRLTDHGLDVPSAIGFGQWIVDDRQQRTAGLEQCRRDMELLAAIGAVRIAAPPSGATEQTNLNLPAVAERYRALLELGEKFGIGAQLECWGHSKTLHRLGEIAYVAVESGHPGACLLPDVYHIYRGGSDFAGLKLIDGRSIHVFHMNDYPAAPAREQLTDADRVFPGDGIAPLDQILTTLHQNGFRGYLSLELFNRDYWKRDPNEVAATGLQKMRAAVARAITS